MRSKDRLKKNIWLLFLYACIIFTAYALGLPCVWRFAFGIPCPGCGMTRACLALFRLDIPAAFSLHPMVWSLPLLVLFFLYDGALFRKRIWNVLLLSLIGAGYLVQWIVKLVEIC